MEESRTELATAGRDRTLALLRERIVAFAAFHYRREVAEDVAQDVLHVLMDKYPHVGSLLDLVPLALRIARLKLQARIRTSVRRGEPTALAADGLPLADPAPDPEEQTLRRERLELLEAALRQLGERCRRLLGLKLQGRSFAEIQEVLQAASINTVYTWDLRCRQQLREALGGSWEGRR